MKNKTYDINNFEENPNFFDRVELLVTVKSFDLSAIRQRYLKSRKRSRTGSVERRTPAQGGIVYLVIENGKIQTQEIITQIKEARGIDFNPPYLALSSEDQIFLFNAIIDKPTTIKHPWLSYIHTVHFNDDNSKLLVASSGLDSILEFDTNTLDCTWHWLAWEHGINHGQNPKTGDKFILTRNIAEAETLEKAGKNHFLVKNPGKQHLPTACRSAFINSAKYSRDGHIIATFFHEGKVMAINRETGEWDCLIAGLSKPHGGHEENEGYLVTDTAKGSVVYWTNSQKLSFEFRNLPGKASEVGELEWLQTSHVKDNTILTIDSNRNSFIFFDTTSQKRATILFSANWAVQDFVFLPEGSVELISRLKNWFEQEHHTKVEY